MPMRHKLFFITLFWLLTLSAASWAAPPATAPAGLPPYKNTALPFAQRVRDLISRMTIEEKISQVEMSSPAIPRLGVPAFNWWSEGIHGVSRAENATMFAQSIAMGATWNPELVYKISEAISDEARIKWDRTGVTRYKGLAYWCPTINMSRDARWGRVEETYGEDPFLTSRLSVAYIKAMQGDDPKYLKIAATPKHFGMHSQETKRTGSTFDGNERDLREYYFPAFRASYVEGKAVSCMAAHNGINVSGVTNAPCTANRWLLTKVLRDEWGFDGVVVTDWGAVRRLHDQHRFCSSDTEAVAACLKAGVDVMCDPKSLTPETHDAIRRGILKEQELDLAVSRAMMVRFRLGTFDPHEQVRWTKISPAVVGCPKHLQLALRSSLESIVLLKNDAMSPGYGFKQLLPLDLRYISSVAVLGPNANELRLGAYSGPPANPPMNVLDGIRNRFPDRITIRTARWPDSNTALKAARESDVAIVVAGLSERMESEGRDRQFIELPPDQADFVRRVYESNPCTVLVLIAGSPLAIPWAAEKVPAILMAWYPGEQGGNAVADVLTGRYNPAARTPVTWPRATADLPALEDYDVTHTLVYWYNNKPVLWPFGHGLSYTTFEYSNIKIDKPAASSGDTVKVSVEVKNIGQRDGDEVVQLYVHDIEPGNRSANPIRQLKGFQRVNIPSGQTKTVDIPVAVADLAYWDTKQHKFVVEPGNFEIQIGASSVDIRLKAILTVK